MNLEVGNIVTTTNAPDTHKRVCRAFAQNTAITLEWWDETGPKEEHIHRGHCRYIADKPTKQFLEMKELWEQASKKFHDEHPDKPKNVANPNTKRKVHFGGNHENGGAK